MKRLNIKQFKNRVLAQKDLDPEEVVVKDLDPTTLEATEEGEARSVLFRISDGAPDREGDVIVQSGVDTVNFMKGGSVLWNHTSATPEDVIGRPTKVFLEEGSLFGEVEFTPKGLNPQADMVFEMIKGGFIRGASVGIIPLEVRESDRPGFMAMDFVRSELLEFSVTPLPANPRALAVSTKAVTEEVVEKSEPQIQETEVEAPQPVLDDTPEPEEPIAATEENREEEIEACDDVETESGWTWDHLKPEDVANIILDVLTGQGESNE